MSARLIRRGYFKTKTIAGRVLIQRSEAEAFEPPPKGRPPKKLGIKVSSTPTSSASNPIFAKGYISQAEAARIRGVSQQAIANLIRRGRLDSVSVASRTLVLRSAVQRFVPKSQPGRPPKKTAKKTAIRKKTER